MVRPTCTPQFIAAELFEGRITIHRTMLTFAFFIAVVAGLSASTASNAQASEPSGSIAYQLAKQALNRKDFASALELCRAPANQGDPHCQNLIGVLLRDGLGVEKNVDRALKYFRNAAEKGNFKAQLNLATALFLGEGTAKNAEEGFDWAMKAAQRGFPAAQVVVGEALEKGMGTVASPNQAADWYRKALAHKSSEPDALPANIQLQVQKRLNAMAAAREKTNTTAQPQGTFPIANAMRGLYGNFDESKKGATWLVAGAPPKMSDLNGTTLFITPYISRSFLDGAATKHVLVTSSLDMDGDKPIPSGEGCHACGSLIGAALFEKRGQEWVLVSEEKFLIVAGAWGGPPGLSLVLRREGGFQLRVETGATHQGITTNYSYSIVFKDGQWVVGSSKKDVQTTGAPTPGSSTVAQNEQKKPLTRPPEGLAINASVLYSQYSQNEIRADQAYKGKLLEVSGTSNGVRKDFLGNVALILHMNDALSGVVASMPKEQVERAAQIGLGSRVTVICKEVDMILGSVVLGQCAFK